MDEVTIHPASYKDPSGFVFKRNGLYYRHIDQSYGAKYELLIQSGLYKTLAEKKLLIPHEEINENLSGRPGWYKTLFPKQLGRISYSSEWTPGQLKDAALLTLRIMSMSIEHGMILKDATPFNVQFINGQPMLIDTLSFEPYNATQPWVAYRQFCECFIYPLYIHHYLKAGTEKICLAYPNGVPGFLTAKILPLKSFFNGGALLHVFLQSSIGKIDDINNRKNISFNEKKMRHLVRNLENVVKVFDTTKFLHSGWDRYYEKDILSAAYLENKEKVFLDFIEAITFKSALDLGANNGRFSLLLAQLKAEVIAVDADWKSIEKLHSTVKEKNIENILPLCIEISQPTPGTGFQNTERPSFHNRMQAGLVVALALVHHLVFGNNLPLHRIAEFLASLALEHLVVEFIPLEDEKVQELLCNKNSHHPYSMLIFEESFNPWFTINRKKSIDGSTRVLYLMQKKTL